MVTWWLLGIHQKWWCKSSAANGYHGWITKGYTWSICVIVKKLSIFPMGMVIFGKMSIPQIPCFHNGTNIYKYVYSCMTPFMATIQLLNYNQTQATVRSNVVKSEIVAVVQKILQLSLRYHHCRAFINLNKYQTFRKKMLGKMGVGQNLYHICSLWTSEHPFTFISPLWSNSVTSDPGGHPKY